MRTLPSVSSIAPKLLTVEDWAALEEDVEGELVDGRLEEEEVPTVLHEAIVAFLMSVLVPWARTRGGLVLGSEAKLAIGKRRGRKPDACVFLGKGQRPSAQETLVQIPPHVVVEVVSPRPRDARRDRVDKHHDYARLGVRFYWILDPQLRTLEILELDADGRYVHVLDASEGRLGRVPGCAGLMLDLDTLWAASEPGPARRAQPRRSRRPRRT